MKPELQAPYVATEYRIWWIPQIGMDQIFYYSVASVGDGHNALNMLANYDIFQFENNVKPDYSNMGGLEGLYPDGWSGWHDDDDCDIYETLTIEGNQP